MTRKDDVTQELPGVPRRRGRPPTGTAKSGASRQAAYRQRLKESGLEEVTAFLDAEVAAALRGYVQRQNADRVGEPITLGEAVEKILRDRLLRKR